MKSELTPFTSKVIKVIKSIPKGKVATYRQVAILAGKDHASRGVSWILSSCSKKYKLPWHRIISSKGKIAFDPNASSFTRQRRLLEAEGVMVEAWTGNIDMNRFQYKRGIKKQRHF